MNPRLIKFAVELQNTERSECTIKYIDLKNGGRKILDIFKFVKVTVPVDRNS